MNETNDDDMAWTDDGESRRTTADGSQKERRAQQEEAQNEPGQLAREMGNGQCRAGTDHG